jgi:hypothetical protein
MRAYIFITLVLTPFLSQAENIQDSLLLKAERQGKRDTIVNEVRISHPILLAEQEGTFDFWDNMPWISAMFIGAVTLYLGHRQLKSNERILKEQIKSSQEIAKLDFNKVVMSGNRQEWINELRNLISSYMAQVDVYQSIFTPSTPIETVKDQLAEILALEIKIALMLNPAENDSIELTKFLHLYTQAISREAITQPVDFLKGRIVEITQRILKTEWNRVKRGE